MTINVSSRSGNFWGGRARELHPGKDGSVLDHLGKGVLEGCASQRGAVDEDCPGCAEPLSQMAGPQARVLDAALAERVDHKRTLICQESERLLQCDVHALALGTDEAHCQRGRVGRAKVLNELCHESLVGRCGCGHGGASWAQTRSRDCATSSSNRSRCSWNCAALASSLSVVATWTLAAR